MPFRNLKFIMIISKALGLVSCKSVNGRLKSSSAWSRYFCVIWILFHCFYMSTYYYKTYMASPAEKVEKYFALTILRTSAFFVSLLPYNFVAAFWSEDFVKLSDKLLTYDEHATALGHRRKDKHIFTNLFFVYTLSAISWKTYHYIDEDMPKEIMGIVDLLKNIVFSASGAYCVFLTCIFLDLIRQRFRHLNETVVPHVSELPVTGSQGEITVYDVRYLHGVLFDGAVLINALYGIGTLLTFLSILLEFVWSIYTSIKDLQDNKDIQGNLLLMLDLWPQTIFFLAMYHFTTYEANRVEKRVIKYGLSFSNKKCRIDKIEMMLYFYHKRYSFTAAEFFPLDMTILLPIATAVITYLILIV